MKLILEAIKSLFRKIENKIPTKLSDLENDLYYIKQIPVLTLTLDDLDENGNYIGSPAWDWLKTKEDIFYRYRIVTNNGVFEGTSDTDEPYFWTSTDRNDVEYLGWCSNSENLYGYNGYDYEAGIAADKFMIEVYTDGDDAIEVNVEIYRIDRKRVPIQYCDTTELEAELNAIYYGGD